MIGQGETLKHLQPRFPIFFYSIAAFFSLLGLRLVKLQLFEGARYRAFSDRNSLRKDKLPGPRGLVFDRQGRLLVDNRLQLDVVITPQFVREPQKVVNYLASVAGVNAEKLFKFYQDKIRGAPRFQAITLIPNADWSLVSQIESSKDGLSGVDIEPRLMRTYLQKDMGAQVFGYLGEVNKRDIDSLAKQGENYESGDVIGRGGIEKQWERYLRGNDGVRFVVVDAHGHRIAQQRESDSSVLSLVYQDVAPRAGHNLVLTLDSDLQKAAWDAMEGKMGATVALDPRTGEVLAMVSKPSFDATQLNVADPAVWQGLFKNPYGPLRNKAIQDHYAPGSTFKPFTVLAALENNIITRDTLLSCPATLRFGNRTYHEHNKGGFGRINLVEGIMRSSNVFMWQLAMKLDINQIASVATDFGLGTRTGIDLPGEIPGLIPTREWKTKTFHEEWFQGETLSVAIGQGSTLVTPLQLALAYGTIGNGGLVFQPYVVSKITDSDGSVLKEFKPKLIKKRESTARHLDAIHQGLHDVVNKPGGTAYWFGRLDEVEVAGKSGTSQVASEDSRSLFMPCRSKPFESRNNAWFVAFAPYDNPEIVVATFGMHECLGAVASGPVVKAVIKKFWEKKKARESLQGPQPASTAIR
ncbi:MAG: penicillin-binding protein 2 [Bdellovibrionota bacterium]